MSKCTNVVLAQIMNKYAMVVLAQIIIRCTNAHIVLAQEMVSQKKALEVHQGAPLAQQSGSIYCFDFKKRSGDLDQFEDLKAYVENISLTARFYKSVKMFLILIFLK